MIELKYGCLGFRCPVCGKNVIEMINRFQFSSGTTVHCPACNTPVLSIQKKSRGSNLSILCFACGNTHSYSMPASGFFSEKPYSFCCKENDVDILYTGTREEVDNALFQLSNQIAQLTDKYYKKLEDQYGNLTAAALKIIEEKARDKRIICLCGSYEISLKISSGGIELSCPHCGGSVFIPVATEEDLHILTERRSILIK